MGYVEKNLMPGERIVYSTRLHWIVYTPAIIAAAAGIAMMFFGSDLAVLGISMTFVIAPLVAVPAWVAVKTSEFAITDKRVMVKVGLIRRHTLEMQLAKVENVAVDQGIEGRLFGYGTVTITGTGGTPEPFKRIRSPLEFRKHIQMQIAEAQMPSTDSAPRVAGAQRECPHCAETILAKARVCKHCGRDVQPLGG